ncbi:MAG: Flp pilus assembly protein CpaB [Candidatus Omnitrophota bacterium]
MNLENKKQIVILLLAVGVGLFAVVLASNYVQQSIQTQQEQIASKYAASLDPLQGKLDALQAEVKRLEEEQKKIPALVQQAASTAGPGQPGQDTDQQEQARESKSSLALRTPPGKRAYTVRIDSLSAVGGMVNPGDIIDVMAHMKMPDPSSGKTEQVHSMLFQNVLILAVGTDLKAGANSYQKNQQARALNLTFALSPEEATLMSFIEKQGKMKLVLRAPDETETEVLDTASWRTLADYVYEKQGTELVIPRTTAFVEPVATEGQDEVEPFIQIFQGGQRQ